MQKWANQAAKAGERLRCLAGLDEYPAWEDLDWEAVVNEISALNDERDRILSASNRLVALTAELSDVTGSIKVRDQEVKDLERERGGLERDQEAAREAVQVAENVLARSGGAEITSGAWTAWRRL